MEDQGFLEEERFGEEISRAVGEKEPRERSPLRRVLGGSRPRRRARSRPENFSGSGSIELERARKTLFPNEASNYQLGGQFAAVAGFVLDRACEKGLGRDLPPDWFVQTLLP